MATSIFPKRAPIAALCVLLGRMDEARRCVDEVIASFPSHFLGNT